ncbi:MAG: GGDEF domain-containing protein [Lachnospiraceae bacterium]|nr:GGDEF domain-containing protein [Lachnospiraceae bacterium]
MDESNQQKKLQGTTITLIVVMAVIFLVLFRLAFIKAGDAYTRQLYDNATDLNGGFLKETVDNLIRDIDSSEASWQEEFSNRAELQYDSVRSVCTLSGNMKDNVEEYFKTLPDAPYWTWMLYNDASNEVYLDSAGLLGDAWDGDSDSVEEVFVSAEKISVSGNTLIYGIRKETLHNYVKDSVLRKVRGYQFSHGVSAIIDEIMNEKGGKNFAKRLACQEDPKLEGMLLSFDMRASGTMLPYNEILYEAVRTGSFASSYSFDEDGTVKYRQFYSAMYPEYRWLITLSAPLDDIETYVRESQRYSESLMRRYLVVFSVLFLLMIVAMFFIMMRNDRNYFDSRTAILRKKVERDALTGATTRDYGTEKLRECFDLFKAGKKDPAIMILDVDRFKGINDTYGHDVGDIALKRVVRALYRALGKHDYLIRWGGDEFIGLFPNLKHEDCMFFMHKVLNAVRSVEIVVEEDHFNLTASIGFAYFSAEDNEFEDGLKRADTALYASKEGGRNQVHLAEGPAEGGT